MTENPSQHAVVLHGLALVHTAIRRSLDTIVATTRQPIAEGERAAFSDFCERLCRFVRGHHDAEEQIFFPVLKRGELSDRIATFKQDHDALLGKLDELDAAIAHFKGGGTQDRLAISAAAVRDVLFPHLDAEESALDEATFKNLVSGEQAMQLALAASRHGQRHGGPRVFMLFLHALTDDEQRSHFGRMPWFVRRVLVRIWDRGFRHCVKYAHNPSIAL